MFNKSVVVGGRRYGRAKEGIFVSSGDEACDSGDQCKNIPVPIVDRMVGLARAVISDLRECTHTPSVSEQAVCVESPRIGTPHCSKCAVTSNFRIEVSHRLVSRTQLHEVVPRPPRGGFGTGPAVRCRQNNSPFSEATDSHFGHLNWPFYFPTSAHLGNHLQHRRPSAHICRRSFFKNHLRHRRTSAVADGQSHL
jgi:hypothetical protein